MADIEKVMKGLKKLRENSGCLMAYSSDCKTCPYLKVNRCCDQILADALELLKAQQPRVLTLDEARNHEVVWAEDRQNDDVNMCVVQRNMNDSKLYKYGVQWRVWSARPTDEQRKAVKWDD